MIYDTDIIIIGAGVAGLKASKILSKHHIPHMIFEASHRIGGRAYSEHFGDGSWFDLGCSYLHEGEINPFSNIAKTLGIRLGDGDQFDLQKWKFGSSSQNTDTAFKDRFIAYFQRCQTVMEIMTSNDDDSMAEIIDWNSPFASVFNHCMAGLCAADISDLSVADYLNSGEGLDYPVADGLGNLIAEWGKDVSVELNSVVNKVQWAKDHVRVSTSKGTCTASKALITVSTGILGSGMIRFTPELPDTYIEAISRLPCGVLNKIGMSFTPNTFSNDMAGWHIACPDLDDKSDRDITNDLFIGSADINVAPRGYSGTNQQAVIFAGGSHGEYLEKQGPAALEDYAKQTMISLFGETILKNLDGVITTAWGNDPWTLGSYSYAHPGAASMRQVLMESIENTLFFAGEAASITHYGTCHGAYISGRNTAMRMIR